MNILEEGTSRKTLATDVHAVMEVLRSKAMLIAICTFGAVLIAFVYTCFLPRVYSAQTVIQIAEEEQKVVKIDGVQSEDLKSLEALKTFEHPRSCCV